MDKQEAVLIILAGVLLAQTTNAPGGYSNERH